MAFFFFYYIWAVSASAAGLGTLEWSSENLLGMGRQVHSVRGGITSSEYKVHGTEMGETDTVTMNARWYVADGHQQGTPPKTKRTRHCKKVRELNDAIHLNKGKNM